METQETEVKPVVKKGFNEMHYALLYMICAVIGIMVAQYYDISFINIASSSVNSVALWLVTMFGLVLTLNGLKCNVWHEIIVEGNTGLGNMIGLFGVALAVVIHG